MPKETRLIVGPHSHGLTMQIGEDVTVYVGMPPPKGAAKMKPEEAERQARQAAVRALKLAISELEEG